MSTSVDPSITYANVTVFSYPAFSVDTKLRIFYTTDYQTVGVPLSSYTFSDEIITLTVNPLPIVNNVSLGQSILCQNSNTLASNYTPSGVWSSDDLTVATINSSSGAIAAIGAGIAIISYTVTDNNNCVSIKTAALTVNPTPIINSYNDAVCSGQQYSVIPNGSVPSGTTFAWLTPTTNAQNLGDLTGMAPSGTSTQTTVNALLTNNTNTILSATYSITATKGACSSAFNLTLSVTPKPLIIDRNYQACSGAGFTDPVSNGNGNIVPAGITYYWSSPTVPAGITNQAASGTPTPTVFGANLINSTNGTLSVTYTISTYYAGCQGTTYTETVYVNPTPNIFAKAAAICSNTNFTIPINNGTDIVPVSTTYTWNAPVVNGISGTQAGTNTSTVTGILSNTTISTISVQYILTPTSGTPTIGYCSGSPFNVVVTVYPVPVIANVPAISTSSSVQFNYPIGQAGDKIPVGTTYFWGAPAAPVGLTGGVASATQTQTSLNGTLINPTGSALDAIYTIVPSFNNCQGNSFTLTVRVYPRPIIGSKTATICSGQSFGPIPLTDGVNGDVIPGGTTYSWSAPVVTGITGTVSATAVGTISGTISNNTNNPITVIYVVTPYANPQAGDPFNVVVVVNPLPVASILITENSGLNANDQIICNDVNAKFAALPVVGSLTDYNYTWAVPLGAIAPGNVVSFSSNIAGSYGLNLVNISTGCTSAVQTTTSLTVNPVPTVGGIVGANNVCVNSTITLSTSNVSGGSGTYSYYYWYDNNSLVAPFTSPSVNVTGVNAGDGLITYKVQDNLGCYSAMSSIFTLHVNALPLAPTANSINQPYDGLSHTGAAIVTNPLSEQIDWWLNNTGLATSVAPTATNVGPTITKYATARNTTTGCVSARRTTVSVTITSKTLTITATDFTKTYDRIAYTGGNGVTYNGFANGENESVLSGTLTYGGTAQNAINAGTYTIVPTGLSSGNYSIRMIPGKLVVNAKALTISGATVQNKIYDATDIANMDAGTLNGVIVGDIANVTLNRIAKFSSKNVGSNLVITSLSTISGTAASNYVLDPTINVKASITEKYIDAIDIVTSDKVYDATTTANVTGGSFKVAIPPGTGSNNDNTPYTIDKIQLKPSGYFASKDVGANINIVSTSIITGADSSNYILNSPTLSSRNITPKALSMTGLTVTNSKIYDGTTNAVVSGTPLLLKGEAIGTGTVNDGLPYNDDVVSITGSPIGTYNNKDVLTGNTVSFSGLSLTGANANNYSLTFQSNATSSILAKNLTMFGLSVPASKIYDGTTSSVVYGKAQLKSTEAPNSGDVLDGKPYTGDDVSITGTPIGNYNSKNVTTAIYVQYSGLSISGTEASNYNLIIQANDSSKIAPLNINVVANKQSKIYGEVDPAFTYLIDPIIVGDSVTGVLGRVAGENVGLYQINIGSLTMGENYTITYTKNDLSILPAAIVVKPSPIIRTYGDAPLPNSFTTSNFQATGLVNGESIDLITVHLPTSVGSGNAFKDTVGTYLNAVRVDNPYSSTFNLSNYQFSFLPTNIVVEKYEIYISADDKQKRMSQADPPLTYLISRPLVDGDSLSGSLTRVPGEEVGYYSILQGTLKTNNNYSVIYIPGTLEIQTIERILVVPNAFTPNNDGLNDILKIIYNSTIVSINYFKIFNRTGGQIFETRNISEGWNGKINGLDAPADAYFWIVEYNTWDNKIYKTKGSFLLLK